MKILLIGSFLISFISPTYAVTTKMFKVLDTCARYRLNEFDVYTAMEKLKLKSQITTQVESKKIVSKYCSVFTPNEKIKF
tara:strand:- start:772 stop:1011 length:240 start_codon:yes stop_codon:yes gene_type:complete